MHWKGNLTLPPTAAALLLRGAAPSSQPKTLKPRGLTPQSQPRLLPGSFGLPVCIWAEPFLRKPRDNDRPAGEGGAGSLGLRGTPGLGSQESTTGAGRGGFSSPWCAGGGGEGGRGHIFQLHQGTWGPFMDPQGVNCGEGFQFSKLWKRARGEGRDPAEAPSPPGLTALSLPQRHAEASCEQQAEPQAA